MRGTRVVVVCMGLLWAGAALAFDSLFEHLPDRQNIARLFGRTESYARVKDGLLLGRGYERTVPLKGGGLRVEQARTYTRLLHPDTQPRLLALWGGDPEEHVQAFRVEPPRAR